MKVVKEYSTIRNPEKRNELIINKKKIHSKTKCTNYIIFDKKRFNSADIIHAKFLAQELLLTETLVNRLHRVSKRPIVVIGIKSTGVPYTWGIKPKKNIVITTLNYPSYNIVNFEDVKLTLLNILTKYRTQLKKPLFVFIDSSKDKRIPSSMVGTISNFRYKHSVFEYTQPQDSIKNTLENNYNIVRVLNYNWGEGKKISENPGNDFISFDTKNKNILNKIDVILFNPSKERTIKIAHKDYKSEWESAAHDDNESRLGEEYKKLVLHFLNETKYAYFNKLKKK